MAQRKLSLDLDADSRIFVSCEVMKNFPSILLFLLDREIADMKICSFVSKANKGRHLNRFDAQPRFIVSLAFL